MTPISDSPFDYRSPYAERLNRGPSKPGPRCPICHPDDNAFDDVGGYVGEAHLSVSGKHRVCIDGWFSAIQLRRLADEMDAICEEHRRR